MRTTCLEKESTTACDPSSRNIIVRLELVVPFLEISHQHCYTVTALNSYSRAVTIGSSVCSDTTSYLGLRQGGDASITEGTTFVGADSIAVESG